MFTFLYVANYCSDSAGLTVECASVVDNHYVLQDHFLAVLFEGPATLRGPVDFEQQQIT